MEAYTILPRQDTAADWTSANPTLANGEFGIELDTGKFKIGDGSTAWNALAYFSGEAAAFDLDDAADVVVTTPADNELLAYDSGSGDWINQTAAEAGIDGDMAAATYDPAGVAEQLVGLTATQALTNKDMTDFSNDIDADDVHVLVRNDSGVVLQKGTPVYISGYNVGAELVLVDDADASSAATMPAIGLLGEELANNAMGSCIETGRIEGVDTSAFSVGDELYVSETAGDLTATKPTGSALVQKVATVLRVHATLGVLAVGTTSAEDLPNIAQDNVWVGNANGVPTATAKTALGLLPEDAGSVAVTATHTLLAANAGKVHEAVGTFTITLPNGLDAGYQAVIENHSTGAITLSATTTLQKLTSGTGLETVASVTVDTAVTVRHKGSNVWVVVGDYT